MNCKIMEFEISLIIGLKVTSVVCNRQQFTVINNVSSCFTRVSCGVPQGSTLGPLLFLLSVNYISLWVADV